MGKEEEFNHERPHTRAQMQSQVSHLRSLFKGRHPLIPKYVDQQYLISSPTSVIGVPLAAFILNDATGAYLEFLVGLSELFA